MKKIFLILAAAGLLSVTGCGTSKKPEDTADTHAKKTNITADTDMQSDTKTQPGTTSDADTEPDEFSHSVFSDPDTSETNSTDTDPTNTENTDTENTDTADIIHPQGMTTKTRFAVPEGYLRTNAETGSLTDFLRNYPLKEDKSPVLLYDGKKKSSQNDHTAVFTLPIENEDLQQCADSVMRVYAEYFRETGQYERIAFHFVNGFCAEYVKWRDGYRIQVNGNQTAWTKSAAFDDSYENFQKYLRIVFSYAGTLSMEAESEEIPLSEIRTGDVFLTGGSPGHVVMLVDLCENAQGKKAFLLAQGYMPAQEFHILKNPLHENDPWYYEEEVQYPFRTPEYTFEEGSLRRLSY